MPVKLLFIGHQLSIVIFMKYMYVSGVCMTCYLMCYESQMQTALPPVICYKHMTLLTHQGLAQNRDVGMIPVCVVAAGSGNALASCTGHAEPALTVLKLVQGMLFVRHVCMHCARFKTS